MIHILTNQLKGIDRLLAVRAVVTSVYWVKVCRGCWVWTMMAVVSWSTAGTTAGTTAGSTAAVMVSAFTGSPSRSSSSPVLADTPVCLSASCHHVIVFIVMNIIIIVIIIIITVFIITCQDMP